MLTSYTTCIQTIVPSDELIVSRTDLFGKITYANETFAKISGYSIEELIGKNHRILRHPDMPKSVFQDLWQTLKKEKLWKGYIKNLRKDGGYYWVYAEISGVYKEGKLVEYKSMRTPIDDDKKTLYQKKYDDLMKNEENSIRAVVRLRSELIEKLQKLSYEKKKSIDTLLNEILDDTLF